MSNEKNDLENSAFSPNLPLLDYPSTNLKMELKVEIQRIIFLIKSKYCLTKKKENLDHTYEKNFIDIKNSAHQLNVNIKKQKFQLTNSIENQKNQLKKLHREKVLFDQNEIQNDIINNQEKLIENLKKNNNQLKLNLNNMNLKINVINDSKKKFLIDNNELKNLISRFIKHNKNLQNDIHHLKKNSLDSTLVATSKLNEMSIQIKFYQKENIRLSNVVSKIKRNHEITTNNLSQVQNEKDNIYKKIKELNNSLITNNVISSTFISESITKDLTNPKKFNNILDKELKEVDENEKLKNLDHQINNIFNN